MFQKSLTHGPAPITTCSHSIIPSFVITLLTVPLFSLLKPFTVIPLKIVTPPALAFFSKALIESLLKAYPPFFS